MDYLLEQLGFDRFQYLAQALISAERPGVQCLPIGQPDGGRDAFHRVALSSGRGLVVFQVKYVNEPTKIEDPHRWLVNVMAEEAPKVAKLLDKGVNEYILITNIRGTAHLDSGSIDRLQKVLDDNLPIPSLAWWRNDINRRIDAGPLSLKWSYPEITRGSDILGMLLESNLDENRRRRTDALRLFVTDQYESDEEVRFKQIELQNDLLHLFIDVPAIVARGPGDKRARYDASYGIFQLSESLSAVKSERPPPAMGEERYEPVGAAALLLSDHAQKTFQYTVVEGAPGQGKSTLAQFLCQAYRMRLLNKPELQSLPECHQPNSARIPIKVDLTEYALWLAGTNPFVSDDDGHNEKAGPKHLEAFLAALVSEGAGGAKFSVDDLQEVCRNSLVLLVLDGLDEVAEVHRRERVIQEITKAVRRLRELAPDLLQVVITTRPSAFAGVSEFSTRTFHYIQLVSLSRPMIFDYAERWATAKKLSNKEASTLRRSLQSRLDQPHLRDLARNPMQLAILLSVIHSRGTSLPDKRTALYEIYVELFLARESEKSSEVREHQELLVDVHCYLAWILHARAEAKGDLGRIEYDRLMETLRSYLQIEGREVKLADELFTGAQRVVFLVARVEGTFEFEVQPLREYFAGKYLYETSAYSPAGRERSGTMPDRFDALARNPYWLNVTRFFAGFLNKGELPALVDRLQALVDDDEYRRISHPRFLAATLLADWVFSQHQRSLRFVVKLALEGPGLRALTHRAGIGRRQEPLVLPPGSGHDELVQTAFESLDKLSVDSESLIDLTKLLQANGARDELQSEWLHYYSTSSDEDKVKWLAVAHYMGVLAALCAQEGISLLNTSGYAVERKGVIWLYRSKCHDMIRASSTLSVRFTESALDGSVALSQRSTDNWLSCFHYGLSIDTYTPVFGPMLGEQVSLGWALSRYFGWRGVSEDPINYDGAPTGIAQFCERSRAGLGMTLREWRTSIKPWDGIVELAREIWGERRAITRLAVLAALGAKDGLAKEERSVGIFDDWVSLCTRTRVAKLRAGSSSWWRTQWSAVDSVEKAQFSTTLFLCTAGPTATVALLPELCRGIRDLTDSQFEYVSDMVAEITDVFNLWGNSRNRLRIEDIPQGLDPRALVLVGLSLPWRAQRNLYDRFFRSYGGSDPIVLSFCQDVVAKKIHGERGADASHWEALINICRRNPRSHSPTFMLNQQWLRQREFEMPLALAREVATDDTLPAGLVAVAERVCAQRIFETATPILAISERDEWFTNL